jgi:hypothetical protein
VDWAQILEEKNARIAELEAQLAEKEEPRTSHLATDVARWTKAEKDLAAARDEIQWAFDRLAPPLKLEAGNRLPAVRDVRERLGKYLEKNNG